MSTQLPLDVLIGLPEPTRARWQPLRAGVLNLFRYDEQTFAFHRGRLLLRGNNGTGKSMALEVLLPFVLDAELSPMRLSTFGGRDRSMYLWLIGYDRTGTRNSERAYVWVEFGRRYLDGRSEFFTAGAMLEGTRGGEVKPTYFTTAARIGVDIVLGRPGSEPLNKQQLAAALADQAGAGRTGAVHPTAKAHRGAVNDTLYRLTGRRFDTLRATLLQLRRPKLSDKLDESGLNHVLRNSLPPIADATVADLAEGFERLDRHAAAVEDLAATIGHLNMLQGAYRRYARVAGTARADAVTAAESALDRIREDTATAEHAAAVAQSALDAIAIRRDEIRERLDAITGEHDGMTKLEAYRHGQDLEPLRELVAELDTAAARAGETARRARERANVDERDSERATTAAIQARDAVDIIRPAAIDGASESRLQDLDVDTAAALRDLAERDVADIDTLTAVVGDVTALLTRLDQAIEPWAVTVASLVRLTETVRADGGAVVTARSETERAEGEVHAAEVVINRELEDDQIATLAHLDALAVWAQQSSQLTAGQAPPLPWDAETVLVRAPRWAAEARAARTEQLLAEVERLSQGAVQLDDRADRATEAGDRLNDLAAAVDAAAIATAAVGMALAAHLDQIREWVAHLVELPSGSAPPDFAGMAPTDVAAAAVRWAEQAATAWSRVLVAEQTSIRAEIETGAEQIRGLTTEEARLAAGGLPEVPPPASRIADRNDRPGAPLFQLVEFADGVPAADRRGIEAAVLDSGIADAWVSPDGTLLVADDRSPLRDTQLTMTGPARSGVTLDRILRPDVDPTTGVSATVVGALLARIGVADTAGEGDPSGIVVGRDGSWRAGALTGAHAVDEVTLIGAANREAARLVRLETVRAALAEAQAEANALSERQEQIAAALDRVDAERAGVPDDADVQARHNDARTAAEAVRTAVPRAGRTVSLAIEPAADDSLEETRRDAAASASVAEALATMEPLASAPVDREMVARLRSVAASAAQLGQARRARAEALRAAAGECRELVTVTGRETEALPPDDQVRAARSRLEAARVELAGASSRLARRREEEAAAVAAANVSQRAAAAAVFAAGLPDGCDVDALALAIRRYRTLSERWLRAGAEAVRSAGFAAIAAARTLASGEAAAAAEAAATDTVRRHRLKTEELQTLTDNYGADYKDIVARLGALDTKRRMLNDERDRLEREEHRQAAALATAEAEQARATENRRLADTTRDQAIAGFLAAARIGVLTAAGLPDAPTRDAARAEAPRGGPALVDEPIGGVDGQPEPPGLGRRVVRGWARAVREAAGDRLVRDVAAVEQAANRVTETRYNLEPNLSGRVSIRDEHREGLLVLHASRGAGSSSLLKMVAAMAAELDRDRVLLAEDEAELFRKFLADATRREVTGKVRDARTAIKEMAELMAAHPTGSGLQVRLRWVPDERNAPGMQHIVTLMGKDAPLDSEKERLQEFFRMRVAQVRANADDDYRAQMAALLDYRQWWRFIVEYRRGPSEQWAPLTSRTHGALSGGEKAVCLHLPLFAAAASYCDSAGLRVEEPDGSFVAGAPRLILLDEVFAGVDEDNRGELFEIVRRLDLDLVATSESDQGLYEQLDGLSIYQLVTSDDAVLAARTVWDGRSAHQLLNDDLGPFDADDAGLFSE
jgi:hypothetical protein